MDPNFNFATLEHLFYDLPSAASGFRMWKKNYFKKVSATWASGKLNFDR